MVFGVPTGFAEQSVFAVPAGIVGVFAGCTEQEIIRGEFGELRHTACCKGDPRIIKMVLFYK